MVGHGIRGRAAALVVAALALGAPMVAPMKAGAQIIPASPQAGAEEEALWGLVQGQGTADAYRNYISTYPNGAYAAQARARLGQLQAGSAPIVTAPPASPAGTQTGTQTGTQAPATVPVVGQPLGASGATTPPVSSPSPSPAEAARAEAGGQGASEATSATETALALTLEDRRAIQSRLTLLGHDTRGIDGTFGSGTRSAIRAWQTGRGFAATGYLTAAQAQELRTGTTPAPAPVVPATPATPATGATAESETALGLTATEKRIIQSRLTQLGHDTNGIDGSFGSGTRRAITAWQKAANLPATGFLTRADADALMNAGTTPAGRVPTDSESAQRGETALNLSREDRVAVQQALVAAGHDTRGVDGTFGSGTRRAIRDWQTARGEPATGFLTAAQMQVLNGQATGSPATTPAPSAPAAPGPGATAAEETGLNLGQVEKVEVQSRLSALGYDPKGIDGRFGSGTRRAISAWQGDNGLAATGYLNADQLECLRGQRRN